MAEEKNERVVLLKNGARIEAGLGSATYLALRGLLEQEPELFQSLLALAREDPIDVPENNIAALRDAFFLRSDGRPSLATRNVLLSAYRQTPDGPTLVHPFRFGSAEEVKREERAENNAWDRVRRWLSDDDTPGSGGTHSRG